MRRELRLMNRLNGMYLNPDVYLKFQDSEDLMKLVKGGYDARMEFDLAGMDLAPSADPKSVTDMQVMLRAQYMQQFLGQPGINNAEVQKFMMEAARIPKIERFFTQGPDPMAKVAEEKAKHEAAGEKADVILTLAKAEKVRQETEGEALERGTKVGMAGGLDVMAANAPDQGVLPMPGGNGAAPAPAMGGPV
jgi:hypothetical protein